MRKLLLAGVAALSASAGMAGYASAQTSILSENPNAPQPAPQLFERKGAYPGVDTYAPPTIKQSTPEPAPGQMIVRLQGLVEVDQQFTQNGEAGTPPPAGSPPGTGGSKLANYATYSFARLYPSLEGRATNGLKYGAFAEIRQDNSQGTGAGGGLYGSPSGTDQRRGELYWRREYGYFGTDQLGIIRVGAGDQPTSLFLTGNMENFDAGGWNGDLPDTMSSSLIVSWPFEDVGSLYSTEKVVYLSPQFAGFDFGVSYEPSTAAVGAGTGCATVPYGATTLTGGSTAGATAGCTDLSSTGVASELSRRRNTFDGVLRYRAAFGPLGIAATAGGMVSSKVANSNNQQTYTGINYKDMTVADFGATITYAGLIVGGHLDFGAYNPFRQFSQLTPDGVGNGLAYVVGASYQPAPPFIFGAHYLSDWGAGNETALNKATVGELNEQGVAIGATYSITPGFNLFLSGIWGQRKESGFNLVQGSATSTGPVGSGLNALDHNKTTTYALGLGEAFHW